MLSFFDSIRTRSLLKSKQCTKQLGTAYRFGSASSSEQRTEGRHRRCTQFARPGVEGVVGPVPGQTLESGLHNSLKPIVMRLGSLALAVQKPEPFVRRVSATAIDVLWSAAYPSDPSRAE
jgi:hypothetical protein